MLGAIAARQEIGDDSAIDYSDIPALTADQLAELRRPAKRLLAVRLDEDVCEWLRQSGAGYSAVINQVLRTAMSESAGKE